MGKKARKRGADMRLGEILDALDIDKKSVYNFSDVEISDITERSCEAGRWHIFVCIRGSRYSGADFADKTEAPVLVAEELTEKMKEKTVILSKNPEKTMAMMAKVIYSFPEGDVKLIGITGTKGKTTTAKFLEACLAYVGIPSATIGTLGIDIPGEASEDTDNTTPASPVIYRALKRAWSRGVRYAILEVSSKALVNFRVFGLKFDCCVFTSFSCDHIGVGEHKNMKEYYDAKRSLFTDYGAPLAVVNGDDINCRKIAAGVPRVITCGESPLCDFRIEDVFSHTDGVAFTMNDIDFPLSLEGRYNAANAALAIVVASELSGVEISRFERALQRVKVRGRFEMYDINGTNVVIDFAHNAESLKELCLAINRFSFGRTIVVFGSVGERSHARRRDMARIAENFADFSIITSDNPGFEDAGRICEDIYGAFMDKDSAVIIEDREEAIKYAVRIAERGDYVLLVGKGHEEYQLVGGKKIPFSEREILRSIIKNRVAPTGS